MAVDVFTFGKSFEKFRMKPLPDGGELSSVFNDFLCYDATPERSHWCDLGSCALGDLPDKLFIELGFYCPLSSIGFIDFFGMIPEQLRIDIRVDSG